MTITRTQHRAACVAALYILEQRGLLQGKTQQQIADMLGLGHRSGASRYMRDVRAIKPLVDEMTKKACHESPATNTRSGTLAVATQNPS